MKFFFSVLRLRVRSNRRSVAGVPAKFLAAAILLSGLGLAPPADAQQDRYLDVHGAGEFKPIPIAVTAFSGDAAASTQLTAIVTNNFKRSVFLAPIDPKTFIETIANPDQAPQMDSWRMINAQFVVTGRAGRASDGRLQTEFRLWEVATGKQIAGSQYVTDPNNARRVAHIVSDAIFSRITGEQGFFDTQIAFVDETGPPERRRKRLAIMDQDGANLRYMTRGDDLVVTPRFSPSSQDVTYMSFGASDPKVLLLNIETGQREVVGNFPGMTFSPRFSPDGQKVVMSLTQGMASNLYTMDLRSRTTTRLSNSNAIDTSPSYSPDGTQIVLNRTAAAPSRSMSCQQPGTILNAFRLARGAIRRRYGRRKATISPLPSKRAGYSRSVSCIPMDLASGPSPKAFTTRGQPGPRTASI